MPRRLVLSLMLLLSPAVGGSSLAQVPPDDEVGDDVEVQGATEDTIMPKDGFLLAPSVTGTSAPAPPWPTPCNMPTSGDATRAARGQTFNDSNTPLIRERATGLVAEEFQQFIGSAQPRAIPVTKSAVVVIGRVMSGSSFVSPDGTTAYSEYGVKVESVLARSSNRPIAVNETITVLEQGGLLLFSDRNLQWHSRLHRLDIPKRLGRYVLFLQWNSATDTFPILTGYRLQGAHVVETLSPNFRRFVNYKEDAFVQKVRTATATRIDQ